MSKLTYTDRDVAGGFAGAATFSPAAAAAVAKELNAAGDLGSMDPDDAARAVQAAVHAGTKGATVSIDLSLAALTAIHARKGAEGAVVGFEDQPGAARASSSADGGASAPTGSGTAAAAGPGSSGAGGGSDTQDAAEPTGHRGRKLTGAAKAAAERKAAKADASAATD